MIFETKTRKKWSAIALGVFLVVLTVSPYKNIAKADPAKLSVEIVSVDPNPIALGRSYNVTLKLTSDIDLGVLTTAAVYICAATDIDLPEDTENCLKHDPINAYTGFHLRSEANNTPSTGTTGNFTFEVSQNHFLGTEHEKYFSVVLKAIGYTTAASASFPVTFVSDSNPNSIEIQVAKESGGTGLYLPYSVQVSIGGVIGGTGQWDYQWTIQRKDDLTAQEDNPGNVAKFDHKFYYAHDYVISVQATQRGLGKILSATKELDVNTGALRNPAGPPIDKMTPVDALTALLTKIVQGLVFIITGFLYGVIRGILTPAIQIILSLSPHDAAFSAVILTAWVFVRNVVNILFVVALIALGVATLLRVDEEHLNYKHLIPELVLMALLVNFSLVIAQMILGIADTLQAQFLPNNNDVINTLARELLLTPNFNTYVQAFQGSFAQIISSLVYLVFAIFSFIAFGLIAAFLVIRVVALWFLLMLSPVAYAANVLPWTHEFASQWWDNFIKYSFFTPAIAFFLHVCAVVAVAQSSYMAKVSQSVISQAPIPNAAQFVYGSLSSALLIICLMAGLQLAHHFGIGAAEALVHNVQHKVGHLAHEGLHAAQHRLGAMALDWKDRKITNPILDRATRSDNALLRTVARATAPVAAWQARGQRVHHEQEKTSKYKAGMMGTMSEYAATHGHVDLESDIVALRTMGSEYSKVWKPQDSQRQAEQMANMMHSTGHLPEKLGILMAAFESGRLKDDLGNILKDHPDLLTKPEGVTDAEWEASKGEINSVTYMALVDKLLGSSEQAKKMKSQILSQMAKDGNLFWAIYPGAPDGKGGFIDGSETMRPDLKTAEGRAAWDALKKSIGLTADLQKDDEGKLIQDGNFNISRQMFEQAIRAIQTEDANDLIKVGTFKQEWLDNEHYHPAFLKVMSRVSEADPQKLLGASPDFWRENLGITGRDSATGALIFKDIRSQRAFEHGMTTLDANKNRIIRPEFANAVLMAWNKENGSTRPQDATQTGVSYMAYNEKEGQYQYTVATKENEPTGKILMATGSEVEVQIKDTPGGLTAEQKRVVKVAPGTTEQETHSNFCSELRTEARFGPGGMLPENVINREMWNKSRDSNKPKN